MTKKIKRICTIFFLLLLFPCFNGHATEVSINDADATNIVLKNISKLDNGSTPRFSPDGKQIIFTKTIRKKHSKDELTMPAVFVMDKYGKNKKMLFENGHNAILSPDGAQIAYCMSRGLIGTDRFLAIYDINAKKKFELIETDCTNKDVAWTKDGKNVFFGNRDGNNSVIINLDTLSKTNAYYYYCEDITHNKMNEFGMHYTDTETVCKEEEWRKANLLTVLQPKNINIYMEAQKGDIFKLHGVNLWIKNRDNSFERLLLPEDFLVDYIDISPDFSKILFTKPIFSKESQFYIADIAVVKDTDLPARTFRVPIGRKKLLEESSLYGSFDKHPEMNNEFVNRLNTSIDSSSIYADISNPKYNPLTKKTIGHGNKIKGRIEFVKVYEDYSIVQVVEERESIAIGDVIWNFKAPDENIHWEHWSIIATKTEWKKEESPKEISVLINEYYELFNKEDFSKAFDLCSKKYRAKFNNDITTFSNSAQAYIRQTKKLSNFSIKKTYSKDAYENEAFVKWYSKIYRGTDRVIKEDGEWKYDGQAKYE